MHALAASGDVDALKAELKKEPRCRFKRTRANRLPLHCVFADVAPNADDITMTQHRLGAAKALLTSYSTDVQQQLLWCDDSGMAPIHYVCPYVISLAGEALSLGVETLTYFLMECNEVGQLLIGGGAQRHTILHFIAAHAAEASICLLIPFLTLLRALHPSIYHAALQLRDVNGKTPLHLLCSRSPLSLSISSLYTIAQLLASADVLMLADASGSLPLHLAVRSSDFAVLVDLLACPGVFDPSTGQFNVPPAIVVTDRTGATPWALAESDSGWRGALQDWLTSTFGTEEKEAALDAVCTKLGIVVAPKQT